jgi:hypothetical protein
LEKKKKGNTLPAVSSSAQQGTGQLTVEMKETNSELAQLKFEMNEVKLQFTSKVTEISQMKAEIKTHINFEMSEMKANTSARLSASKLSFDIIFREM